MMMANVRVHVANGSYRNQKIEGVFDLVKDVKLGKSGRRRGYNNIWYLTVKLDPSRQEFCGWGLKRNDKVRIIVPGPNNGYRLITEDVAQDNVVEPTVSEMINALPNNAEVLAE